MHLVLQLIFVCDIRVSEAHMIVTDIFFGAVPVQRVCQGSTVLNKHVSDLQTTSQEATGDKS